MAKGDDIQERLILFAACSLFFVSCCLFQSFVWIKTSSVW